MTDTALSDLELARCAEVILHIEYVREARGYAKDSPFVVNDAVISDQAALYVHAQRALHTAATNTRDIPTRHGWLHRIRKWFTT